MTGTVLVSAITSALVSMLTFVVSVRVSKDQGDRAPLRAVYQRLFEHFRELREAIRSGRPKTWGDYPLKGNHYVPPFSAMQISGEANLLPPQLALRCDTVERETLISGSKH